jgi:hypothetical protein
LLLLQDEFLFQIHYRFYRKHSLSSWNTAPFFNQKVLIRKQS